MLGRSGWQSVGIVSISQGSLVVVVWVVVVVSSGVVVMVVVVGRLRRRLSLTFLVVKGVDFVGSAFSSGIGISKSIPHRVWILRILLLRPFKDIKKV